MRNLFVVLSLICCLNPCLTWAADNKPLENTEFQVFKAQTELKLDTLKENQAKAITEATKSYTEDLNKQNVTITAQDKRIGDLNLYLAIYAVIGGVLGILVAVAAYLSAGSKAREEARKEAKECAETWFNKNENGLLARLKALEDGVTTHANNTKKIMTANADALKEEKEKIQKNMLSGNQIDTPTHSSQLKIATEEIAHKPSAQFTYDDWDTLAFNAINENKIALAVEYWGNAAQNQDADDEKMLRALCNKAVALGRINQPSEAIIIYEKIIHGYDSPMFPNLQIHVANAINGLGFQQLLHAKQVWADFSQRETLLNVALTLFRKSEAKPTNLRHHKAAVLGNLAYVLWLLGRTEEVSPILSEALKLGGKRIRNAELEDTRMHTVDADAGFVALVKKLWVELQSKVAVGK